MTLIAGIPAACVGDMAVCVGPPDVIITGAFTCLVNGKPLARLGDSCAHGGKIVLGCMTVLVGDSGGGGGGGGGGGDGGGAGAGVKGWSANPAVATMMAARAAAKPFVEKNCAAKAALAALKGSPLFKKGDPKKKSWVEVSLVDEAGEPVPYERYRVTAPDGDVREGFLDAQGLGRVDGIDPGTCKITFPNLDKDAWEPA